MTIGNFRTSRSKKRNDFIMELSHLKAFVEVARTQNLTRAAETLHLSPSALSTQIKILELEKQVACHAAFQKQLERHRLTLNIVSYSIDDQITRELIRDGHGIALLRSDEAQRLVAEGNAVIWDRGTVTVPLGLACLAENQNDPLVRKARQEIAGLW